MYKKNIIKKILFNKNKIISLQKYLIMKNNLKEYLNKNNITQSELAKRMGKGTGPQHVHYYVNAKNMSTRVMSKISRALKVSPDELFKL